MRGQTDGMMAPSEVRTMRLLNIERHSDMRRLRLDYKQSDLIKREAAHLN